MTHGAFDDALADDPELNCVEDALLQSVPPISPTPAIRDELLSKIELEPQVASLHTRRNSRTRLLFATAAAITMLAGAGLWISNVSQPARDSEISTQAQNSGSETISEVMTASDVRHGRGEAMGANFEVAVSDDMGKGGLLVNGAPKLNNGMGAQVWAVMENGDMHSAGVIDQAPHNDVWMPLPAGTMSVMVTEEPMVGSNAPQGSVLAEVKLA